jgi:hypothetical protein
MRKPVIGRAIAVGVAALFVLMGAISFAEAGRVGGGGYKGGSAFRGGNIHVGGGSVGRIHTNPGGKYMYRGAGTKFHTNPGGKYVYRGSGTKFHTNPGGKYRWYGHNYPYSHYNRRLRYGSYPWIGVPLYSSYGGGCSYLYRRAIATNSPYWWDRYRRCTGSY